MAAQVVCPDLSSLEQLARGHLSGEQAEAMASHIERCPNCVEILNRLAVEDTWLGQCRTPRGSAVDEQYRNFVERVGRALEEAREAAAPSDTVVADKTKVAEGPPPAARPEGFEFLSPPEAAGELGRLGEYRVLDVLGAGGMGIVFRAEDTRLQRLVALKVLRPALAESAEARERFLREARSAAMVEHDHVGPIYQVGESENVPYLAMPLLSGRTLEARLAAGRPSMAEVLVVGRQIALGLAAAHGRGLVHRDLKPSNIWLETDERGRFKRARLLDFGLARTVKGADRLTRSGALVGTPGYLSPEQARGLAVDSRADLFSFGCLLYEMAAGRRAFAAGNLAATLAAVVTRKPEAACAVNPDVPRELSDLIASLLNKEPSERPESASAVASRLAQLRRQQSAGADDARERPAVADKQEARRSETLVTTSGSPWAGLGKTGQAEAVLVHSVSVRTGKQRWRRTLLSVALLAGLAGVVVVCGAVIRVQTSKGELVVEADEGVEVTVKQGKVEVYQRSKDRRFEISPGNGEVEFYDPDTGVKLATREFRIERGGKQVVSAKMASPQPSLRPPDQSAPRPAESAPIGRGQLTVETSADALVTVKLGHVELYRKSKDRRFVVDAGAGEVDFYDGTSGKKFASRAFQIEPGGSEVLTARPPTSPPQPSPGDPPPMTELESAEWIVTHGGSISYHSDSPETNGGASKLSDIPRNDFRITFIGFHPGSLDDAAVDHLRGCSGVADMQVIGQPLTEAGWDKLVSLPGFSGLRKVELTNSALLPGGLASMPKLRDLEELVVFAYDGDPIGAREGAYLRKLPRLKTIQFGSKFTDAALTQLEGMNLHWLNIPSSKISGASGKAIGTVKQLRYLNLTGTLMNDAGLAEFGHLPRLEFLWLGNTCVTDKGLQYLSGLSSLRELGLHNMAIGDDGLAFLEATTSLRKLDLHETKVSDRGLVHIAKLIQLESLNLDSLSLTDKALTQLAGLSWLQQISLMDTKVTDDGLKVLSVLPSLKTINLGGLPITDNGLATLGNISKLWQGGVDVRRTKVTREGAKKLATRLNCGVVTDFGTIGP